MDNNLEATYEDSVLEGLYSFTNADGSIPRAYEENYFVPYPSRYAGGFSLLSTMKVPRPCAYASQNLGRVEYYRGQNTMQYDIYQENSFVETSGTTPYIIFQDGSNANALATFND